MSLTNEEIINSQAFKILNHMIDMEVENITNLLKSLKDRVEYSFNTTQDKDSIQTRTHEEGGNRVTLPVSCLHDFKVTLSYTLEQINNSQRTIQNAQVQKLKLLNDWDFTHGDTEFQQQIFGKQSSIEIVET